MEKRKVSAREAVADIRRGMDDSALMKKYHLTHRGLQSLFDKLVARGYIDLAEMEGRISGPLGTVVISETLLAEKQVEQKVSHQLPKSKPPVLIFAQQAARDIRSGMDDSALMEKYRLSSKGLRSLYEKLVAAGAITQLDVDRRGMDDHTVDLREDVLSLSVVSKLSGTGPSGLSTSRTKVQPDHGKAYTGATDRPPPKADSLDKKEPANRGTEQEARTLGAFWYDKPFIVMPVLVCLFPIGCYALYRNSTLSTTIKTLAIVAWILLAIVCLILISRNY